MHGMCVLSDDGFYIKGPGSQDGSDIKGLDLGLKTGRCGFLNFQMPQFSRKNIFIFLAVNSKTTLLDYVVYIVTILSFLLVSAAPTFDSHWLNKCANSTP